MREQKDQQEKWINKKKKKRNNWKEDKDISEAHYEITWDYFHNRCSCLRV
jgi:DNA/RNA endonuclease G (NUC1)